MSCMRVDKRQFTSKLTRLYSSDENKGCMYYSYPLQSGANVVNSLLKVLMRTFVFFSTIQNSFINNLFSICRACRQMSVNILQILITLRSPEKHCLKTFSLSQKATSKWLNRLKILIIAGRNSRKILQIKLKR